MNILDWVILIIVLLSGFVGLFRGIIIEILRIINLGSAIFISYYFSEYLYVVFSFIRNPAIKSVVAATLTFIFMFVLGNIFIFLLSQMFNTQGLGKFFDRSLGGSYGVVRGIILVIMLVLVLEKNSMILKKTWWVNSKGVITVKNIYNLAYAKLPKTWQERLNKLNNYGSKNLVTVVK